jgi:hypothetical protein
MAQLCYCADMGITQLALMLGYGYGFVSRWLWYQLVWRLWLGYGATWVLKAMAWLWHRLATYGHVGFGLAMAALGSLWLWQV